MNVNKHGSLSNITLPTQRKSKGTALLLLAVLYFTVTVVSKSSHHKMSVKRSLVCIGFSTTNKYRYKSNWQQSGGGMFFFFFLLLVFFCVLFLAEQGFVF